MDERVREFLTAHHETIMTTVRKDGTPHVARVIIGLVDGKLWSSGTADRVRTKHLRSNPKAALCVLDDQDRYTWMGLETEVDILDGPERVEQNLALYRALAGEPTDLEEYKSAMESEGRLIYQFNIVKAYGQF
jgi:PPOX class probable F420-dependent enzyme